MTNQINQAPAVFKSQLAKINDTYMPQIETQLHGNGIRMTEYQRTCVINSISSINEMLVQEGIGIQDVDQSNLTQTLMHVAALQLNATATPREVYFIKRNQKRGKEKNSPKVPIIEMGIEGDGNDAILSRFGRNVKTVHRHWEVRENDQFAYPGYAGLQVTPPTWTPSGQGKVIRVVYPIEYNDGQVEFFISEREDVKANLLAHMYNNLMWDSKKAEKKEKIKVFSESHTLDDILENDEMQVLGNISPAWKEPQSKESMIVRKMRNRIVKKIPKDFSNAYIQQIADNIDDDYQERQLKRKEAVIIEEIEENANSEIFEPTNKVDNERPSNVTEDGEIQNVGFSEVENQNTTEESSDPY